MLLGVFGAVFIFYAIGQRTFISFTELFRWFALFAFAGNLVPVQWYTKPLAMDRMEWFWFNLLAIGPLLLCTGLLVNFFFHGKEEKMLVHAGNAFSLHTYWRTNGEFPPHLPWPSDLGADPDKDRMAMGTALPGDVVYGVAKGAFGYLVITSRANIRELSGCSCNERWDMANTTKEFSVDRPDAPLRTGSAFAATGLSRRPFL